MTIPHVQKIWKVVAIISLPCLVISAYPMTIANEEFRTKLTISFPRGGMHILTAWGMMTNRIVCM